jgi:hypothetical protein
MDFTTANEKDRKFYTQDFSELLDIFSEIKKALISGEKLSIKDLSFVQKDKKVFVYITLFQAGLYPIRWGSERDSLSASLNRIVDKLRQHSAFSKFDIEKCRILFEYIISEEPVNLSNLTMSEFSSTRFEPGVTGLKLVLDNQTYYYMPTDAWVNSQMSLKQALNFLLRKTYIKSLTNKISERIAILKQTKHECFLIKSRAFVSYKDGVLPLYRGNILWNYKTEEIKNQALSGADWIEKYQQEDGRYLYYYDAKEDNYIDHEHPTRPENNLYYNDLRHCGGIVTLLRAYELTNDEKYLISAKKGLDFISSISEEYDCSGDKAMYVFYNKKAKLGGVGMALIAMMRYRIVCGDKSYDEYIKKYVRHLLSRIYKTGEFLGYYIHPDYHNGEPLIDLTDKERRETFSFYYPGEALLGLALFFNYFNEEENLKIEVLKKSKIALDWIVDERPKIYSDLFTALPSDAWLMQAIEEWCKNPDFNKENYVSFVLKDAKTMIDKMYKKDDSPYIDYEGSFYYEYGDYFYPDGSRSEGLISAYFLAQRLGYKALADIFLKACRKNAQSQMLLFNNEKNTYAHKNPEKSRGAIRFKATRQWVRVDSIQHVACFFFRLYFAEKSLAERGE